MLFNNVPGCEGVRACVRACVVRACVRQILLNLLSNAIKFTPPGGHVTVDVAFQPGPDPADPAATTDSETAAEATAADDASAMRFRFEVCVCARARLCVYLCVCLRACEVFACVCMCLRACARLSTLNRIETVSLDCAEATLRRTPCPPQGAAAAAGEMAVT